MQWLIKRTAFYVQKEAGLRLIPSGVNFPPQP